MNGMFGNSGSSVFLRPCGAYGFVAPPDPGLIALGYYPTPLRGLFRRWFPNPGLVVLGYYPVPLRGAKINDAASPARG